MRFILIAFLSLLALSCIFAPYIAKKSPYEQNISEILSPPSPQHPFGTDQLGRDLFSRVLYGGRITFLISTLSAILSLFLGTAVGILSGYKGGLVDIIIMRILDGIYSFPDLLIIIILTVFLGRKPIGIVLSLSLTTWVVVARIVRGEVMRLKSLEMIESGIALGAGPLRIIFLYIIPNVKNVLITLFIIRIPGAILSESVLSFLGLGLSPPSASWGILVNEGWSLLFFAPHLVIFPSLFIFITVFSLYLLGKSL